MAQFEEKSFIKELNAWVQTIGIIIAAIWGAYTFIYKEIMLPKAAPVNVTVDLQLKKIGDHNLLMRKENNKSLIALEMTASATNPSSRVVYLQPNIWVAYGANVTTLAKNPKFSEKINDLLNGDDLSLIEKHAWSYSSSSQPVAAGRLFLDTELKPYEKINRKIIFHVPKNLYDAIETDIYVPTMAKKDNIRVEWQYDEKQATFNLKEYEVSKNGEKKELPKDIDGKYNLPGFEFQMFSSSSILSLWE